MNGEVPPGAAQGADVAEEATMAVSATANSSFSRSLVSILAPPTFADDTPAATKETEDTNTISLSVPPLESSEVVEGVGKQAPSSATEVHAKGVGGRTPCPPSHGRTKNNSSDDAAGEERASPAADEAAEVHTVPVKTIAPRPYAEKTIVRAVTPWRRGELVNKPTWTTRPNMHTALPVRERDSSDSTVLTRPPPSLPLKTGSVSGPTAPAGAHAPAETALPAEAVTEASVSCDVTTVTEAAVVEAASLSANHSPLLAEKARPFGATPVKSWLLPVDQADLAVSSTGASSSEVDNTSNLFGDGGMFNFWDTPKMRKPLAAVFSGSLPIRPAVPTGESAKTARTTSAEAKAAKTAQSDDNLDFLDLQRSYGDWIDATELGLPAEELVNAFSNGTLPCVITAAAAQPGRKPPPSSPTPELAQSTKPDVEKVVPTPINIAIPQRALEGEAADKAASVKKVLLTRSLSDDTMTDYYEFFYMGDFPLTPMGKDVPEDQQEEEVKEANKEGGTAAKPPASAFPITAVPTKKKLSVKLADDSDFGDALSTTFEMVERFGGKDGTPSSTIEAPKKAANEPPPPATSQPPATPSHAASHATTMLTPQPPPLPLPVAAASSSSGGGDAHTEEASSSRVGGFRVAANLTALTTPPSKANGASVSGNAGSPSILSPLGPNHKLARLPSLLEQAGTVGGALHELKGTHPHPPSAQQAHGTAYVPPPALAKIVIPPPTTAKRVVAPPATTKAKGMLSPVTKSEVPPKGAVDTIPPEEEKGTNTADVTEPSDRDRTTEAPRIRRVSRFYRLMPARPSEAASTHSETRRHRTSSRQAQGSAAAASSAPANGTDVPSASPTRRRRRRKERQSEISENGTTPSETSRHSRRRRRGGSRGGSVGGDEQSQESGSRSRRHRHRPSSPHSLSSVVSEEDAVEERPLTPPRQPFHPWRRLNGSDHALSSPTTKADTDAQSVEESPSKRRFVLPDVPLVQSVRMSHPTTPLLMRESSVTNRRAGLGSVSRPHSTTSRRNSGVSFLGETRME